MHTAEKGRQVRRSAAFSLGEFVGAVTSQCPKIANESLLFTTAWMGVLL